MPRNAAANFIYPLKEANLPESAARASPVQFFTAGAQNPVS